MLRIRRKSGVLVGLSLFLLAAVAGSLVYANAANASTAPARALAPAAAPDEQGTAPGTYLWSYAVKFVCGYQPPREATGQLPPGETVVKPGNYATDINIHNGNYSVVPIRKKVLVLVEGQKVSREPASVGPSARAAMELREDFATMDDCNGLWLMLHPGAALPAPLPLTIGYLVILSPRDLDVDAVYTANAPGVAGSQPTGITEDVERVAGKRIFLPAGVNP